MTMDYTQAEIDLCNLLHTMNIAANTWVQGNAPDAGSQVLHLVGGASQDPSLSQSNYPPTIYPHFEGSSNGMPIEEHAQEAQIPHSGCAFLQSMRSSLDSDTYGTTSGEYLEAIFTHREVFAAHPRGHAGCARGFEELAQCLEGRGWRADREKDGEAAAAFRHEARTLAACAGGGRRARDLMDCVF
ncbi:hypothetical protein PUNSTDRAFT_53993 [Punctularia strigosozonata HHB-11173 SS5]|uniref:uncharacterized protein n=1 Tax=Punctularia strigosozonata (strain HHB-11173) TaxID=741275 RepID=UPI0004417B56|nr:uncharacterized protein PUNSTDRAFT_53993 [Punctularia strigosozonata HHB-11173 SS5]EIN06567.1 hypothetical protein PUNSTDRAFT_53993 [Punctularia strigosozonata HHB-11173 SS5]